MDNKKITCCVCATVRTVCSMQPEGPCRLFCPKCGCDRTHTRKALHPPVVTPFGGKREGLASLVDSVRHLTAALKPDNR